MSKFLDTNGLQHVSTNIDKKMAQYVSKDRTLNGHDLSDDIVLTAQDVGVVDTPILNEAIRTRINSRWGADWSVAWSQPIVGVGRVGYARVAKED